MQMETGKKAVIGTSGKFESFPDLYSRLLYAGGE